ncbi:MAG: hypothetical protein ABJL99_11405 [Aliishimia sp.]
MTRPLALLPCETVVSPCGLIARNTVLSKLIGRQIGSDGFRIALLGDRFILYHPTLIEPDLPWLGDDISYLRRYGPGLFGPINTQLNVPERLFGPLHGALGQRYALAGDILLERGPPVSVCDLARSVPFERANLEALA